MSNEKVNDRAILAPEHAGLFRPLFDRLIELKRRHEAQVAQIQETERLTNETMLAARGVAELLLDSYDLEEGAYGAFLLPDGRTELRKVKDPI